MCVGTIDLFMYEEERHNLDLCDVYSAKEENNMALLLCIAKLSTRIQCIKYSLHFRSIIVKYFLF